MGKCKGWFDIQDENIKIVSIRSVTCGRRESFNYWLDKRSYEDWIGEDRLAYEKEMWKELI